MVRVIFVVLMFVSFSIRAGDDLGKQTDVATFYDSLRLLVLDNKKAEIAKLVKYPYSDTINSEFDFIKNYDLVFTPEILTLINCTNSSDVSKVGWRGYMLLNGVIWFDHQYFGRIKPNKDSSRYVEDLNLQIADTDHWYVRIQGVNHDVGECK